MPERPGASVSSAALEDSFAELRSLIVGPEQRELLELQSHLLDPAVQARDISRILPDAIALRAEDPQLGRVLAPLIENSITASVRKDPHPLADALFPVIGPAIRKAIGHTLAAMMESFSRSVEESLSWRALTWRWTAWRTGKKFGEIVLLNTLQYRVEQVFLIHAETGLLLQHVASGHGTDKDVDQVSAMLTAIQDFVRDSFRVSSDDSLDALRVGDLSVVIERGPYAVVAAVVRGTAPPAVRGMFEEAAETVHRQLGTELRSFAGDATPFAPTRPILEACLVSEMRPATRRRFYWPWVVVAAILVVATAAWTIANARERQRWNAYVDRLRSEPGIVVLSAARDGGRFIVAGLRDPLAADPAGLISSFGLRQDRVATRWEPYEALQPAFVTSRAATLLRPPAGVELTYRDGVLTASGAAPARWIAESERIAPALAGVRRFAYAGRDPEVDLGERLATLSVVFVRGMPSPVPGQSATIRTIDDLLIQLNDLARARDRRLEIEIRGHTDSDGSEALNGALSESRAKALLAMIATDRLDALRFSTRGVASTEPITAGGAESDKLRNRRASIRVLAAVDSQRPRR
jgi:OmpA family protein